MFIKRLRLLPASVDMDSDSLYRFFRPWVEYATRCHYASISIHGKERLPRNGRYIIAPCHQNALMEPLLVLMLNPEPIYFICRGDIFAHPLANRFLTFLKMFPIFRQRDGLSHHAQQGDDKAAPSNMDRNRQTFDLSRQVLLDGYPLCMMAEGRHNDRHQLLPLVKGMFRIAAQTQKELNDEPLYIVPLGIDLDDYERPYSNAVLNIGEPIDVRPFMETYAIDEAQALNAMRQALTTGLQQAMHHIGSKQYYTQFEALCDLLNRDTRLQLGLKDTPYNRFVCRQQTARRLDQLEQSDNPDDKAELQRLLAYADERIEWCERRRRRLKSIAEPLSLPERMARISAIAAVAVAAVAAGPIRSILIFALLSYPLPLLPTHLLVRRWIDDSQFRSSINFGLRLALSVIYTIAFAVVIACLHGPLWGAAAFACSIVMARIAAPVVSWIRRAFE